MSKIIFLDIDGTIRDFDGFLPDSAAAAIREARRRGNKVCICSGRPLGQIDKRVMDIGFDGVISCAGSYVLYQGECVRSVVFEHEISSALCRYLVENHCVVEMQRLDYTFLPRECRQDYIEMCKRMMEMLGSGAKAVEEFPEVTDSYQEITNVEKVLFFSNELPYDEVKRQWGEKVHMTTYSIPSTEKWGGEISPLHVNKTAGIKSILEAGGFSREDVIAIGDSDNDIDMLEFAAVGIAMGNATEGAKKAADFMTDELRKDGVYKAFASLGLI